MEARMDMVELFVAFLTLVVTVFIGYVTYNLQEKIAVSQRWDSLMTQYCSPEFGKSLKAIVDFYIEDCERTLSKIVFKYKEKYKEDFPEEFDENVKRSERIVDITDTLHFHRRTIAYFYWQLNCCVSSNGFNKQLLNSFSKNEMNLMVIVYYMGEAAKDSEIYKSVLPNLALGSSSKTTNDIKSLYNYFKSFFNAADEDESVLTFY